MTPRSANRLIPSIVGVAIAGLSLPAGAIDIATVVPEPGTMALLLGGIGAGILVWRSRKK